MWDIIEKAIYENPFTDISVSFMLGMIFSYAAMVRGYIVSPEVQIRIAHDEAKIESLERWLRQNEIDLKICEDNLQEWRDKSYSQNEENRKQLDKLNNMLEDMSKKQDD